MELLITKSELPVFNCLKYTALMQHIDDRHISRETSSQISLAKFSAMYHVHLAGRLENFIFSHQNRCFYVFLWSFGIGKKGNAVGLGQNCIFVR